MTDRHNWVSVGIDVAESKKGLDLVALDRDRDIVDRHHRLTVDDVVQTVRSLAADVVCVDSPCGWSTSGRSRLAERQLAAIGIQSYRTPSDPGVHPFYAWMRVGHELYQALGEDYPGYRSGTVAGTAAEVFPHATACLLANQLPAPKHKRDFRRQVLNDHGVPEHPLRTADQVDAALGALTGLIALDGGHSAVGDPDEGMLLLPVPAVPQTPLVCGEAQPAAAPGARRRQGAKSRGRQGATVRIGYVNPNGQLVIEATGLPGTDHGQFIYVLRCERCTTEYGNNGSGNFSRRCPDCQGGAPGLQYR